MRIKDGYLLKEVAGNYVVVPVGNIDFDGMISLNQTGVSIWKMLETDTDFEKLLAQFLDEYDVDEETAKADLNAFIAKLKDTGLLYES